MVIVQLSGGLGNQMFEYALYLKLRSMGKEVKIDDVTCYQDAGARPLQLDVFGLKYEKATEDEYRIMTDSYPGLVHKLRRKLTGRKNLSYREKDVNFDPEVLNKDPALLEGCFQTEKYFKDIESKVREAYRFKDLKLSEEFQNLADEMKNHPASVSVHIRRGDYLAARYKALYEGICDELYYQEAIARIKKTYPDAKFYLFSNDPEWVKEHFRGDEFTVVEGTTEDTGYIDLYLMSRCRHNIIANSSFSWWGAWLNENPDKLVIAPEKWLNGRDCQDIYSDWMVVI